MKKCLAICSIFFTVCTVFTGCGTSDTPYDSNGTSAAAEASTDRAEDYVSEAVSGVDEAGRDIITGVSDAADDIVEGFDDASSATKKSKR